MCIVPLFFLCYKTRPDSETKTCRIFFKNEKFFLPICSIKVRIQPQYIGVKSCYFVHSIKGGVNAHRNTQA